VPNNVVFNYEAGNLKTQIFGSETLTPLNTTGGLLNIASISDLVSVTSTDLDIRNLAYTQDTVRVYGSEDLALNTTGGLLNIASISDLVSVTTTDLDIRNLAYTQDTVRVYGSEDLALNTTGGLLNIASISDLVSVTSTDLDIRNLAYTQDTVRVYGSEDLALETTTGWLNIRSRDRYFEEDSATVANAANTVFAGLLSENISARSLYSWAVHNTGTNDLLIRIEVSPNETFWIEDTSALTVTSGDARIFTPTYFLKYSRIAYAAITDTAAVTFEAYYQANT